MVKGLEGKSVEEKLRLLGMLLLEVAEEWPYCGLQLPQGGQWTGMCWSPLSGDHDRIQGSGMKLHQEKFRWIIRKGFFTERWSVTGKGSPEKWTQQKSCQNSRNFWLIPYVIWFSLKVMWGAGVGLSDPYDSFQLKLFSDSMYVPWN